MTGVAKSAHSNLRPTHAQDEAVDLADRRFFALDDPAWAEFQTIVDRPPQPNAELAKLLTTPSVLEG